jgi:hypothetical protein
VGSEECPKSFVSAESIELVETFFVWKSWGLQRELSAREADAFVLMELELRDDS